MLIIAGHTEVDQDDRDHREGRMTVATNGPCPVKPPAVPGRKGRRPSVRSGAARGARALAVGSE
jgi:hypothetical protein